MLRIKSGLLIFCCTEEILIILRKFVWLKKLCSEYKISKPDVPHKGKLIKKKSPHIARVLADETGVVGELN